MCGHCQPGLEMSAGRGTNQLRVDFRKRTRIQTRLDQAGPDGGAFDAAGSFDTLVIFLDPSGGQLVGCFPVRMGRDEFIVRRAVIAGVGDDVQAARLRESPQRSVTGRPSVR